MRFAAVCRCLLGVEGAGTVRCMEIADDFSLRACSMLPQLLTHGIGFTEVSERDGEGLLDRLVVFSIGFVGVVGAEQSADDHDDKANCHDGLAHLDTGICSHYQNFEMKCQATYTTPPPPTTTTRKKIAICRSTKVYAR